MMILVVRNIHVAQPVRRQFIHPILWPRANRSSAPNLAAARAPIGPAPSQSALRHRCSLLLKRRGGGSRRLIPTPAPVTMLSATRAQLPALLLLLLTAARASSESNALESATTTAASTTSGVREENRALRRELKTLLTSMLTRLESHESNIKLIGFDTTKYLGLRLESLLESNITK